MSDAPRESDSPTAKQLDQILLQALLQHLPDAVYFKDRQSRFLRVNVAKARKTGNRTPAELVGQTDFDHFTAEHAQTAFDDEQRIIATGEPLLDREEKETWPDGHVTWVSTTKLPLRDLDGATIGTFGISRDITAQKAAEAEQRALQTQLDLAHKQESIGRLSAGIAHEINTPGQFVADNLRFISTSLQQLARYFAAVDDLCEQLATLPQLRPQIETLATVADEIELPYLRDELPRCIGQSLDGMARIARIVGALKDFAHPPTAGRAPADLAKLVQTALDVSRHEWKYVAELATDFAPDLPPVPVVVDELNQALLHLIINAAHAIRDATAQRRETKGRLTARTRLVPPFAVLEISDTGTGIPESIRPHLFEPFVSTKGAAVASGQGLHSVHNIARRHGGRIEYDTAAGRGTTFRLLLPLVAPGNAELQLGPPPAPRTTSSS